MIDTDKYEGDKPALLAEFKRLQSQYEELKELYEVETRLLKKMEKQYRELKEVLIGDSPNWTHDEIVEQALELATLNHNDGDRE